MVPIRAGWHSSAFRVSATWIIPLAVSVIIVLLYCLFSDLKGIWTDEGARFAIINGDSVNWDSTLGTSATARDVIKAISHTNAQPLYSLLQNFVVRAAHSHNFVLLRLVNIIILCGCMAVSLSLTASWPVVPRVLLVIGTFANGYAFMHVLQIREYTLGLFFLSCIFFYTCFLARRVSEPLRLAEAGLWLGYGLLLAVASFNSLWILPAFVGAVAFLAVRSYRQIIGLALRLLLSFVAFASVVYPLGWNQGGIYVGRWDPNPSLGRIVEQIHLSYLIIITGQMEPGILVEGAGLVVLIAALGFFLYVRKIKGRDPSDAIDTNPESEALMYAMLAIWMISSLTVFQVVYMSAMNDILPFWPRYHFQHYWLLQLLFGCSFLLAFSETRKLSLRLHPLAYMGVLAFGLLWSGVSVAGVVKYQEAPYLDTSLSRECSWRRFAPQVLGMSNKEAVVVSRLLEAATIGASEDFAGKLFVWPDFMKVAAWPNEFILTNIGGPASMDPKDVASQKQAISDRGYTIAGESEVASAEPTEPCDIKAQILRVKRDH
jgi:hypothetical protein